MRLSASRMGLARHCLYWARDDVEWPRDDSSPAAELGRWYHAVAAWALGGRATPRPAEPECMSDACDLTPQADAEALVAEYPGAQVRAEVAYCYSPAGTRHVGFDVGREYGELASDEIAGTADVVILAGDRAVVVDWKTGRREHTDRAEGSAQLALYALMVHEYHGVNEVEVQLRFTDGGPPSVHVYDAFDLVSIKDDIDAMIAAMRDAPEPRPGLHCTARYCPIRTTCPRTVEAVAEVLEPCATESPAYAPLAVVARGAAAIEDADHAASLWHRAAAAQTMLDAVVASVKAYCDTHGPIPLGDGHELACVDETRESLDATTIDALYQPVSQWLTPEQFARLISVSVAKAGLEKAIRDGADRGQKSQAWDAAIDALRTAGVVKSKTITRHRVRKVRKESAK